MKNRYGIQIIDVAFLGTKERAVLIKTLRLRSLSAISYVVTLSGRYREMSEVRSIYCDICRRIGCTTSVTVGRTEYATAPSTYHGLRAAITNALRNE